MVWPGSSTSNGIVVSMQLSALKPAISYQNLDYLFTLHP
jgi:hypothetical protein